MSMSHKARDISLELKAAQQDFEYDDNRITSVIQKTGQHELNVSQFLTLVHDLLDATTETVAHANKLETSISLFGELIDRKFESDLSIEHYFNQHDLSRLVPILAANGYQCMKDLICDDDEEYREILDLFQKGDVVLGNQECNLLKNICLKSKIWTKYQKKEEDAVKYELDAISPLLSTFFLKMRNGIQEAHQLLSYSRELNDMQREAIKKVNKLHAAIEREDVDSKNEWEINSKCQVYSELHTKWFAGVIINITHDNEGEWLHVKYSIAMNNRLCVIQQIQRSSEAIRTLSDDNDSNTLKLQCHALTAASLNRVNVTAKMMGKRNQDILTNRAFSIAKAIECCCVKIIKAQSTIRHSVLLTQEMLKLKPSYVDVKSKQLWEAIDRASIHIFTSALNMVKVSAEYFSYFVRFKQAFDHYQSCRNQPLFISLECLRVTIRDFMVFKDRFTKTVDELSTEAMNCIENLVNSTIGVKTFEDFRSSRERSLKIWLDKRATYDKMTVQLSVESTDIHYEESEQKHDHEESDRFFTLLDEGEQFDDEKLYKVVSGFSMDIFDGYENSVNQLNKLTQRISSVMSLKLPEIKSELISSTISIDNGYYSSKSDSSHLSQQELIANRNNLLIAGFIRRTVHDKNTVTFIVMSTVKIIEEILSRYKKSRRKKKRKKKNKKNQKLLFQKIYEPNANTASNIVHIQKINEWILMQKWYNKSSIKDAVLYGTTNSNGRVTYSLEISEFMRRCQRIAAEVKNKNKNINLIPVTMKDFNNNLSVHYVWIIEIDAVHHIDIGVSFQCIQLCNKSEMKVIFTGFHLNPSVLSHEYESSGLCIGYLNIYSQTKEHFEYRYNKLKSFIRELLNCDISESNFMDWQKKAQKLWNEVIGTKQ